MKNEENEPSYFESIDMAPVSGAAALEVNSEETLIIAACQDRSIRIWDYQTKDHFHTIEEAHDNNITALVCAHKDSFFATGSRDKSIKIWDEEEFYLIYTFDNAHSDSIMALALHPDDEILISGGKDSMIKIWGIKEKASLYIFDKAHVNYVKAISISNHGKYFASGSYDKRIRIWKTSEFETADKNIVEINAGDHPVIAVAFSNDDKYLISSSMDDSLSIWQVPQGYLVQKIPRAHSDSILVIKSVPSENPKPQLFLTGSCDKTFKLWSVDSKTCIRTFSSHQGGVHILLFTPISDTLLTGGYDNELYFWKIKDIIPNDIFQKKVETPKSIKSNEQTKNNATFNDSKASILINDNEEADDNFILIDEKSRTLTLGKPVQEKNEIIPVDEPEPEKKATGTFNQPLPNTIERDIYSLVIDDIDVPETNSEIVKSFSKDKSVTPKNTTISFSKLDPKEETKFDPRILNSSVNQSFDINQNLVKTQASSTMIKQQSPKYSNINWQEEYDKLLLKSSLENKNFNEKINQMAEKYTILEQKFVEVNKINIQLEKQVAEYKNKFNDLDSNHNIDMERWKNRYKELNIHFDETKKSLVERINEMNIKLTAQDEREKALQAEINLWSYKYRELSLKGQIKENDYQGKIKKLTEIPTSPKGFNDISKDLANRYEKLKTKLSSPKAKKLTFPVLPFSSLNLSFQKKELPRNPSCLFHLIAYLFEPNVYKSCRNIEEVRELLASLRQIVSNYIISKKQQLSSLIEKLIKEFPDRHETILNENTPGDHLELAIFSDYFEAEFCIFKLTTTGIVIENISSSNKICSKRVFIIEEIKEDTSIFDLIIAKERNTYDDKTYCAFNKDDDHAYQQSMMVVRKVRNDTKFAFK